MTASGVVAAVHVLFLCGAEKAPLATPRKLYIIDRLQIANSHCGFGPVFKCPPELVTAEGVEDALSVHQATGLPVVAALGASNLGCVPECEKVIIFFDQDGSQTQQVVEDSVQRAYVRFDLRREPAINVVVAPPREGAATKNDANLILQNEGAEALAKMITTAEPAAIPVSPLAERFARLTPEQRANRRGDFKTRVKDAKGTMADFDRLAATYIARRGESASEDGLAGLIKTIKPIDEYIATAELFEMIRSKLCQYVVAEDWQLVLMSIWVIGTYVHSHLSTYPFLLITAPTSQAGKTTAMTVVIRMSYRGYLNLSATEALLAEMINCLQPTLGLDEIDNLLPNRHEVIGIINGSYNKSTAQRGKLEQQPDGNWMFTSKSTWCPKVLAGINENGGILPEATLSRCLIIRMRPKTREEKADPVDQFVEDELVQVQAYGQAWAKEIGHPIADTTGDKDLAARITAGLHGRDADNFRVILTIAYMGGRDLSERVKTAALAYLDDRRQSDVPEKNRQLLADVVIVFRSADTTTGEIPEWMTPTDICEKLTDTHSHFETDYLHWTKRNDEITASLLGKALKPFDIQSNPVHEPGTKSSAQRRVYWSDVEAAAKRYCPDSLISPLGGTSDGAAASGETDEPTRGSVNESVPPDAAGAPNPVSPGPTESNQTVRRGWKVAGAATSRE
jgi:putative DNA primase/helicase